MNSFKPFKIDFDFEDKIVEISILFTNKFTMLEGKASNAICNTASPQVCNICGATPVEMNKIDTIQTKKINEKAIDLSISPLHMWIRSFEFTLHLA